MSDVQKTISPVDGSIYVERPYSDTESIDSALDAARAAQAQWKKTPIDHRAAICSKFVDAMLARKDAIVTELAWQMGRPISQGAGELGGFEERARHMIDIAPQALADMPTDNRDGFTRFIHREPLGVVFTVAAWNFPFMIAVNSVVPAIMAGNAVILKHSSQTPLVGERFAECFAEAGLPAGLFQTLCLTHADAEKMVADSRVDFVAFTGSVGGGHSMVNAASQRFIGLGLELGGKDPAYVRADADIAYAAENLVDGAFFNSGQSCCGIERIYVHQSRYDEFVEAFTGRVRQYRLGNPLEAETNLGPMVRSSAADYVRGQIKEAVAAGATALIDPDLFPANKESTPYLAPQVLVNVNHSMSVMRDESFGPVVGIMPVASDEEAVELMNDSPFGLTASVWTADENAALRLGAQVETGTWFMNRCDYLDPALAWVGVKDSGHGCTLSSVGYEHLTRPKSFHLRTAL